jgi:hypothetical protein
MMQTFTKILNKIDILSYFTSIGQPLRLTRLLEKVDVVETVKTHRRLVCSQSSRVW